MSWKILDEEIINENTWTTFRRRGFETDSGVRGDYFFATTHGGCALVIAQHSDGRYILVNEYRFLSDSMSIAVPGGGIKKDQTPEQAAAAELREETGFEAARLELLHVFDPDPGVVVDPVYVFVAHGVHKVGEPQRDATEQHEIVFLTREEIDALIAGGKITDGQFLAAWMVYRLKAGI